MTISEPRDTLRQRLAYEAARIAADEQLPNLAKACRKAAARLGCANRRSWPTREEIEEALRCHHRLFQGETQRESLTQLRLRALDAMSAFAAFKPHLVGAVLDGTAPRHSPIELHLFVDDPTAVAAHLARLRIPWRDAQKTLRFGGRHRRTLPAFRFQAGDTTVELVVFDEKGRREAPLAPGDRRAMARADLQAVRRLLERSDPAQEEPQYPREGP